MSDRAPRPRQSGRCSDCGVEAVVELAYDGRRWLCGDWHRCVRRAAERRQSGQTDTPSADSTTT